MATGACRRPRTDAWHRESEPLFQSLEHFGNQFLDESTFVFGRIDDGHQLLSDFEHDRNDDGEPAFAACGRLDQPERGAQVTRQFGSSRDQFVAVTLVE